VLTVATRVSQQRTLLLDAQNQQNGARAVLARLIGARVDADFEPEAALAEGALPLPATAQIIDLAAQPVAHAPIGRRSCSACRVQTHGSMRRVPAIALDRYCRRLRLRQAQSRDLPAPGCLEHVVGRGINVSWTLWNGGRTGAEVAEAKQQAAATRERLAEFDSQIALEIRQRQLDLTTAEAQVRTAGEAVADRARSQARRPGACLCRRGHDDGPARRAAGSARGGTAAHARARQREAGRSAPDARARAVDGWRNGRTEVRPYD
jgi:hypothetical protein